MAELAQQPARATPSATPAPSEVNKAAVNSNLPQGAAAMQRIVNSDDVEPRKSRLAYERQNTPGDDPDKDLGVDAVCMLLPAKFGLEQAIQFNGALPNGHAMTHLEHFFDNTGTDLHVDLRLLLHDNPSICRVVSDTIGNARAKGGATPPMKGYIETEDYTDPDWLNAIGMLMLDWETVDASNPDRVRVSLLKKYIWHPNEHRQTQCLHQEAQKLVDKGKAKEFWQVGEYTGSLKEMGVWATMCGY